jgi:hypothetical protein
VGVLAAGRSSQPSARTCLRLLPAVNHCIVGLTLALGVWSGSLQGAAVL